MAGPSNGEMFSPPLPPQPGSIVPLFADRQTIQLFRTFTADGVVPTPLLAGEMAAELSWAYSKLWIGDGTNNRLLLSSNPGDSPFFPTTGGPFLPLVGGVLSGPLVIGNGAGLTVDVGLTVNNGHLNLAGVDIVPSGGWLHVNYPLSAQALNSVTEAHVNTFLRINTAQLEVNASGRLWCAAGYQAPILVADTSVSIGAHTLFDDGGGTGHLATAGAFRSDSLEVTNNTTVGGRIYINTYPPVATNEAVTRQYVDDYGHATFLTLAGGTMTGPLLFPEGTVSGRLYIQTYPPLVANEAVTKQYVDTLDAAMKLYVDTLVGGIEVDGGVY